MALMLHVKAIMIWTSDFMGLTQSFQLEFSIRQEAQVR